MTILVKPISGMLTKDKDNFGKMVLLYSLRIPTWFYLWVRRSSEAQPTRAVESSPNGRGVTHSRPPTR